MQPFHLYKLCCFKSERRNQVLRNSNQIEPLNKTGIITKKKVNNGESRERVLVWKGPSWRDRQYDSRQKYRSITYGRNIEKIKTW